MIEDRIFELFRDNPNREYTPTMIANRFRITKPFAVKCIKRAGLTLNIVSQKVDNENYYQYVPAEPQPKETQP